MKNSANEKNCYVYHLVENGERIFYVGAASGLPSNRKSKHFYDAKMGAMYPVSRRIRDVLNHGGTVDFTIKAENLTADEACVIESKWIQRIGLDNLCNVFPHGLAGKRVARTKRENTERIDSLFRKTTLNANGSQRSNP